MTTIKLTETMNWIESAQWITKNQKSILECENELTIDFSELFCVMSNIVGLIIHTVSERKKNNLKTEVIPARGPLMEKAFRIICGVK